MINVSKAEHEENQLPDDTVKQYKRNELFQIRLTKARDDVRELLNEKKKQGIDLSDYVTKIIRAAEGLPDPSAVYPNLAPVESLQASRNTTLSPELIDDLVLRVMEKLKSSGVGLSATPEVDTDTGALDEQKNREEIGNAIEQLLDW